MTPQTQNATSFRLVAANCKLRTDDQLVYDGTWAFTITGNSYQPDGSCAATCQLDATVDPSAARFGYGAAAGLPVVGREFRSRTEPGAVRSIHVWAPPGEATSIDGVAITLGGTVGAFTALVDGVEFRIAGNQNRVNVTVTLQCGRR